MYIAVTPQSMILAPYVRLLWYYTGRPPWNLERVLPTGAVQLMVNLADTPESATAGFETGAAICGVASRPAVVSTASQARVAGVVFHPGGAVPFLPAPVTELHNNLLNLAEPWGSEGAVLAECLAGHADPHAALRLFEQILLERMGARTSAMIRPAAARLEAGFSVAAVADQCGMTARRFGRRFRAETGMTPKLFARVRRFQRLLAALPQAGEEPSWAGMAVRYGYYDQAHLIHDFRAFTATTPTRYAPRSVGELNHVPLNGGFLQSDRHGIGDAGAMNSQLVRKLYPRLVVSDASAAIDFYTAAFGATEVERYTSPDGKIVHAAVTIGDMTVALKDGNDSDPSATALGGTPVIMTVQVSDADQVGAAIEAAGGTVVYPITDQFYGERAGRFADPFGHLWMISQTIEDLSAAEIQQRVNVEST